MEILLPFILGAFLASVVWYAVCCDIRRSNKRALKSQQKLINHLLTKKEQKKHDPADWWKDHD